SSNGTTGGGFGGPANTIGVNFGKGGVITTATCCAKYAGGDAGFAGTQGSAPGTGGNITLSGTTVAVTGKVSSLTTMYDASGFAASAYAGDSIINSGSTGGTITISGNAITPTSVIYPTSADLTSPNTGTLFSVTISVSPTFWLNHT